ncbi:MAG: MlaD family protein [Cytophagales bacterium]|nr:MlaD family protein [Cytophagales bacterium]
MNESPNKRAIIVGLFIFVGLIILLAGILTIGDLKDTFTKKMRISTHFEDVNGLQPGGNVWFSGVKIGVVKRLRFYGKSQVEVILNIDQSAQQYIRKNAKVKISTDGLIGNKIIVITGGTSLAEQIEEGDTLGVLTSLSTEDMMTTFQESNKNLVAITTDIKAISHGLATGQGTVSKLLKQDLVYNQIASATASLEYSSAKTRTMMNSLTQLSSNLTKKGTLVNDLTTDTLIFNSMKASIFQLQQITDSTKILIANLKQASSDTKSPVGVLLHDEASGTHLKETIKNLETSSVKLDQDLEALQHNFILRGFFKKEEKKKKIGQ